MAEGALSGFATGFGRGLARTGELSLEKKIREDMEKLKLEREEEFRQKRQLQDLKSLGDSFGIQGDPFTDPAGYRKNLTEFAAKNNYNIEFGSGGSIKITQMSEKDKILRDMTPEQRVVAAGGVQGMNAFDYLAEQDRLARQQQGQTTPVGGGGGVFPTVEAAPSVVPTESPLTTAGAPQQFLGSSLSIPTTPASPGITGKAMDALGAITSVKDIIPLAIFDAAKKVLPEGWVNSFVEWAGTHSEAFRKLRGKQLGLPPLEFISTLRTQGVPTDEIAISFYEEYGEKFPFKQAGPMRKGDIPEAFNSLGVPPKFF